MVDISQLREDMKSYMTIEEVLEKHGITFQEAIKLLSKKQKRKPKRKSKRPYRKTGEKYISYYCNRYVIRKSVNGRLLGFGGYSTLEDAVKMRDYLMEHGWYQARVEAIRKRLGV